MVHKPIAIMILPIFVAGILMLGILSAATARGADDNAGGGETQAPPAGGGEAAPAAPPATETPPAAAPPATETPPAAAPPAGAPQVNNSTGTPPESNNTNAYGNAQPDFAKIILEIHNRERAAVGVPPLVWNDELAADAKTYAEHLIATGEFTHPSAEWVAAHPMAPEGENLAGSSGSPITKLAEMAEGWVSEKNNYHGEPGNFNGVGHYTQMVWRTTTAVGCATASGNGRDVLDCRYSPPGNSLGQKPY
jgi:pathogenesis-related protein 1